MGNRATIQFIDIDDKQGVTVYLHHDGSNVREWLEQAAPSMRKNNSGYAAARFIGFCHEKIPGGLSLGVYRDSFEPGDNGLFVVDCSAGKVTRFRDHGEGLARVGRPFSIKLGNF
jgi:hypothetical protein